MIRIRRASERGHANHGWLDSHHTFSFADYYDPKHMGFGSLRVINDDRVSPGAGFSTHPHRDMEIVSYVVQGALEHRDSIGNGSIIRPGEVQRMTAGTGVTHSEYNSSKTDSVRFLQIWIRPESKGLVPGYEQKDFGEQRRNRLCLVASRDGGEGSVTVHQDVRIFASVLDPQSSVSHQFAPGRNGWLQVVAGQLDACGEILAEGDGLAFENEESLSMVSRSEANVLLFDLAS
jgi:hypothetical protein